MVGERLMAPYSVPSRTAFLLLGSLIFNRWTEQGFLIKVLDLKGWNGHKPGMRRNKTDRVWAPGIFTEPGQSDARLITVECRVFMPTEQALWEATNRLAAVLQDGGTERLTVDHPVFGVQYTDVQLASDTDGHWSVPGIYPFQLHLIAPDPKKYGQSSTGSTGVPLDGGGLYYDLGTSPAAPGVLDYGAVGNPGTVTMSNTGTASTSPVFVVTGSMPTGFTITETQSGRRLTFATAVIPGQILRLDSADGTVTLDDDTDRTADLVRAEWTQLKPESSSTWLFEALDSTDAKMTVEVTPAWW